MSRQKIAVVPTLLRKLRTEKKLSQKALALMLGIDQSRLCAIEKGRSNASESELVLRLARALELSDEQRQQLKWSVEHDRLLEELEQTSLAYARQALSELLYAAQSLTPMELSGLALELRALGRSKRRLQSLTAGQTSTFTNLQEEVRMS